MALPTVNLRDLVILVADRNPYTCRIIHGMLRGFGANRVLAAESSKAVLQTLTDQKVDILLCDDRLPEQGGAALTRLIRGSADNENRTMPILVMCSETREATIKTVRDSGANMAIVKPMSAKSLYERLAWVAFNPRQFVDTENYFGPDRRFKIEGYPGGVPRRKTDHALAVAEESGPALGQDDIDSLFSAARSAQ